MRREHASEVTRVNIFTHNGAPQALVGCLAQRPAGAAWVALGRFDRSATPSANGRSLRFPAVRCVVGSVLRSS